MRVVGAMSKRITQIYNLANVVCVHPTNVHTCYVPTMCLLYAWYVPPMYIPPMYIPPMYLICTCYVSALLDVFTEPGYHKLPPSFPALDEEDNKSCDPLADKPLPQGWSRKFDIQSGRPYFEK